MKRRGFFKIMGGMALLTALPPLPYPKNVIQVSGEVVFLHGRGAIVEWQPEPMTLEAKDNYVLTVGYIQEKAFIGG